MVLWFVFVCLVTCTCVCFFPVWGGILDFGLKGLGWDVTFLFLVFVCLLFLFPFVLVLFLVVVCFVFVCVVVGIWGLLFFVWGVCLFVFLFFIDFFCWRVCVVVFVCFCVFLICFWFVSLHLCVLCFMCCFLFCVVCVCLFLFVYVCYEITAFLAILVFWFSIGSMLFLVSVFGFCFFLVCLLLVLRCSYVVCVCLFSNTREHVLIICIFFFGGGGGCVCFGILLFWFFVICQKLLCKYWNSENVKHEECTKEDISTRAVSTGVRASSVENTIKMWLQQKRKWKRKTYIYIYRYYWSKVVLKIGPCRLRNIIGPVWDIICWSYFLFLLFSSFCRENEMFKNKRAKKDSDRFLTQKGVSWTSFYLENQEYG